MTSASRRTYASGLRQPARAAHARRWAAHRAHPSLTDPPGFSLPSPPWTAYPLRRGERITPPRSPVVEARGAAGRGLRSRWGGLGRAVRRAGGGRALFKEGGGGG